jgi:hypothetical protein
VMDIANKPGHRDVIEYCLAAARAEVAAMEAALACLDGAGRLDRIERLIADQGRMLEAVADELAALHARLPGAAPQPPAEADAGKAQAPAPPVGSGAKRPRRSKYAPLIAAALAQSSPLPAKVIGERVGADVSLWWEVFKVHPWFERANPDATTNKHNPSLWQLSEAGRAALASSAATAERAT